MKKVAISLILFLAGLVCGMALNDSIDPLVRGPEIKYLVKGWADGGEVHMYVTSLTYEGKMDVVTRPDITVKEWETGKTYVFKQPYTIIGAHQIEPIDEYWIKFLKTYKEARLPMDPPR